MADLPAEHGQVIPAVVSPQRRYQGGEEPGDSALGPAIRTRKPRPSPSLSGETNGDDPEEDRDLQRSEHKLKVSRTTHADIVEPGYEDCDRNRDELSVADGEGE